MCEMNTYVGVAAEVIQRVTMYFLIRKFDFSE
jgi:hypothetical protein